MVMEGPGVSKVDPQHSEPKAQGRTHLGCKEREKRLVHQKPKRNGKRGLRSYDKDGGGGEQVAVKATNFCVSWARANTRA